MAPYSSPVPTWRRDTYAAISPDLPKLSTKGRNIVITGGGSGIGAAIAKSFARSGAASISILGRRQDVLSSTASELATDFPLTKFFKYVTDLTSRQSTFEAFEEIKSNIGTVDVLVANAGVMPKLTSIRDSDPEEFSQAIDINVKGNLNLVQTFLPVASGKAVILHVSAGAVNLPFIPGFGGYHASKIAAAKIFDYLHHENPELFVLNFHPGIIKTAMTGDAEGLAYDEIELPADFAVWAASEEAKFLNGKFVWANWDVDELKTMSKMIRDGPKFTLGFNS
ncbi:hypothetical protein QM012_002982 [Aureobasidium pullulans]|uniref:Ketoreductase domain-containing protein n=1 Tax=Aureobasidium pullulans TaxID=5580 RepID=A0ABR0T946_AURPU